MTGLPFIEEKQGGKKMFQCIKCGKMHELAVGKCICGSDLLINSVWVEPVSDGRGRSADSVEPAPPLCVYAGPPIDRDGPNGFRSG